MSRRAANAEPAPARPRHSRTETRILGGAELRAALDRLGEEVAGELSDPLALLGIRRRGVPLSRRLARHLERRGRRDVALGELDINLYRDDIHDRGIPRVGATNIPFSLERRRILLVDDVLFTGRTVRAALTALSNFGRPRAVRLLVLVDRGGRELPIAPDFVGLEVSAGRGEVVRVRVEEEDGEDGVFRIRPDAGKP